MTYLRPRPALVLAGLFSLTVALPAAAYFQNTVTEGIIGANLDGVWYVEHQMMPEFRTRLAREKLGIPFKVGPIGESYKPLTGEYVTGVQVTEITDTGVASSHGIFEGDIITRVNTDKLEDGMKTWEEVLAKGTPDLLLTMRRPQLKQTSADLVKIRYIPTLGEEDGQTRIVEEVIRITFLDATLPFADEIEQARRDRRLWAASPEQLAELAKSWFETKEKEPSTFVKGDHRLVTEEEYDSSLRLDDNLRGASFALVTVQTTNPMAGASGRQISSYGFRDIGLNEIRGTFVQATLANAPFPISLEFKGVFAMYKLDDYSEKDVQRRTKQDTEETLKDQKNVELAPDIPADLE